MGSENWRPLTETTFLYKSDLTLVSFNKFRLKNSIKSVQNDYFDTLVYLKVLRNPVRANLRQLLNPKSF